MKRASWIAFATVALSGAAARAADVAPADVAEAESLRPTAALPVSVPADDRAAHDHWAAVVKAYGSVPAEQVTAHPSAADFPGAVPAEAQRGVRRFTFPLNLPRWQSLGVYAGPGEHLTIRVSPADAARGLAVVIGAHTDNLASLGKWVRFPKVSRRFAITRPVTTVANAFGGLVYVDVPRDARLGGHHLDTFGGYGWLDERPDAVPGTFDVAVDGGVASPLFRSGLTTDADWAAQLKSSVAPWGELASDRLVLTAPVADLAKVTDPGQLMVFWDRVVDAEADLAGWPRQPAPPERVVLDRDISAGWMHSGYPIMAHLASGHDVLSLASLRAKGDWGTFHELGHNHEGQAYTFGGDFTEVNVNLFSMFVMRTVVGREMTAHPALRDVDGLLRQRLGAGGTATPWTNLAIFIKTIDAFGWPPLRATLETYAQPGGADGIRTRQQKIDQWVLRYSKATGHDLSAYYAAFGLTCGDATAQALRSLPTWVPARFSAGSGK